jgi:glucokinase
MLANIPKTISQSFGNISAMNLLAGQGIADTYARTLAAYPRPQFATANFQSQKYFE